MTRSFRFSFKDVIYFIILILLVYILVQKFILREELKMPIRDLNVYISGEGIVKPLEEGIKVGDKIYQKGASLPFGEIVDTEVKPAKRIIADEKGQHKLIYLEDKSDVSIKVSTTGFVSIAGSPIIDNTFFYSNQYLPVYTDHAVFTSRVIHIREE